MDSLRCLNLRDSLTWTLRVKLVSSTIGTRLTSIWGLLFSKLQPQVLAGMTAFIYYYFFFRHSFSFYSTIFRTTILTYARQTCPSWPRRENHGPTWVDQLSACCNKFFVKAHAFPFVSRCLRCHGKVHGFPLSLDWWGKSVDLSAHTRLVTTVAAPFYAPQLIRPFSGWITDFSIQAVLSSSAFLTQSHGFPPSKCL